MNWKDYNEKPEKSCNCVCLMKDNYVMTLEYSKKHNAFNAHDHERTAKYRIDSVLAWVELDEFVKEVLAK